MNHHWDVIQIGSFKGNTSNDAVFQSITKNTRAMFIEPVPSYFDALKKNYGEKYPGNKFVYINKAIGTEKGTVPIYYPSSKNDFTKLPWWIEQCSGFNPNHFKDHGYDVLLEKLDVSVIPFNDIVSIFQIKTIDYLETDTEGYDYDILMSIDFEKILPKRIGFEHLHMDGFSTIGPRYKKLLEHLVTYGYKVEKMTRDNTYLYQISSES
jgi:FkbM family methyltransferase